MTEEQKKERSINELVDLPYSEMTEDEIERLVEWKAENKARDATFTKMVEENKAHNEEIAAIHRAMADEAKTQLEAMTAQALENLKAVSNG